MKVSTVLKIALFLLVFTLFGMFIFENLDPVSIWIPLFKGRQFSLILIIAIAYFLGVSNAVWVMLHFGAKMRKRQKMLEAEAEQSEVLFEDDE